MPTSNKLSAVFWAGTSFILLVSGVDASACVVDQDVLFEVERNPIARWIIQADGGSVAALVGLKLIGTTVVVSTLLHMWSQWRRAALACLGCLVTVQSYVLWTLFAPP